MKFYLLFITLLLPITAIYTQVEEAIETEIIDRTPSQPVPPPQPMAVDQAPKNAYHGKMGGRYGFYKGQEWLVPPIYDELEEKYSDFMVAKKNDKYGVINRLNEIVLPFEYEVLRRPMLDWKTKTYADFYNVEKDGLKGIMGEDGQFIIPLKYRNLTRGSDGTYIFGEEENGFGIMTKDGEITVPQVYQKVVRRLGNSHYLMMKNGKVGAINLKNEVLLPFEWDEIEPVGEYLLVKKGTLWGIVSRDFKIKIAPKYDSIIRRFNRIFKVKIGEQYGALNSNLKEIIPLDYTDLTLFHGRYFSARKVGGTPFENGVIDTLGKKILKFEYHRFKRGGGNLIFAKKQHEWYATFNQKGKQISPPTYRGINGLNENFSAVIKDDNGKQAVIDANGKVITPYIYDYIKSVRDRKDETKKILQVEREGVVGTLNPDGTESDDFREIKRRAAQQQRGEQKRKNLLNQLKGEWYGLTELSGQQYLQKVNFLNESGGVRTIYYLEKGKECAVDQYFETVLSPSIDMLVLKFPSRHIEPRCDNVPTVFNGSTNAMFTGEILRIKNKFSTFSIKGYAKKETPVTTTDDYDLLREIVALKPIEADLKSKAEPRPGGLNAPEFMISPTTKTVQLFSYSIYDFGKIELVKDGYIFLPRKWAKQSNFSLAGILRNVRYRDENGVEKRGDLDICFFANKSQPFYFKELGD